MPWRKKGNPLFGPDWVGTPRGEGAEFIPPPLGETCWVCDEEIIEGDTGEVMPFYGSQVEEVAVCHRECTMLNTLGHVLGYCSCTDYCGLTKREAGKAVMRQLEEMG